MGDDPGTHGVPKLVGTFDKGLMATRQPASHTAPGGNRLLLAARAHRIRLAHDEQHRAGVRLNVGHAG